MVVPPTRGYGAALPRHCLGQSRHVAEPSWLRSLDSEKWLNIHCYNFAAAHFVVKYHIVKLFETIASLPLVLLDNTFSVNT